MNRAETRIIAYTASSHSLVHILELVYPAVLVLIASEFQRGEFALGVVATIFAFAFGLIALPAGFLVDRIGSRRIIVLTLLGAGVAAIGVGLSPNIYILGLTLGVMGLAAGLYHPAGLSLIARAMKAPPLAFAYHGIGGNFGLVIAPLLAGGIASLWDWRASYLILALPALFLAGVVGFSSAPGQSHPEKASPEQEQTAERKLSRNAITSLAIIYMAGMFLGFIFRGSITFLPLHLSERAPLALFNIDPTARAGFFVTLALLFGMLGQYVGGHLARRIRPESLITLHAMCVAPVLALTGVFEGGLLVAMACLFAFVYFVGQPVYNTLVATYSPPWFQGRAFGIFFFFSFGLGSVAATFGGYIAERLGTNWVFIALASISGPMLMSGILLTYRARLIPSRAQRFLDRIR